MFRKLKGFLLWILVPREIILRQRNKIYSINLNSKVQGSILFLIIIVLSWGVYSSFFFVKFDEIIYSKNEKINALNDNLIIAKKDQKTLKGLTKKYKDTMGIFLENTENNLEDLETTIKLTGLKVDDLVFRSFSSLEPVGGPFVPDEEEKSIFKIRPKPKKKQSSEKKVNNKIKRLEILQNIMPSIPLSSPLDYYWVSSNFGKRKDPINGKEALHHGIDLVAQTSTVIMSTAAGMVTFSGKRSKYGNMVEIDHGYGIKTRYGHLKKISVKKGEIVDFRQEIGKLGSSGRVTGPHVHYEVLYDYKALNPAKFINAGKSVFKIRKKSI